MKYYIRTQNSEVTQVWMSLDEIKSQEELIRARCEIIPIKISTDPMNDIMGVKLQELQEIDRDDFIALCNHKNLLAITNYMTLTESHISS